ncbi:serine/threonine-protein kinase [Mycobacterium sp. pUA109]|uniref:serine/threonine-protein kinase n=1 Tax=Mycobacterium sp. pUA109 TaxID=3238982 RepID=UPI00351BDCFD
MPLVSGAEAAGGFRIIRLLGCGGMGEVYLAEHPRLPRRDALKILPRDVSDDPGFRARFNRESELAAGLWHPHVVGLHDRGEFGGQLWLSMDYVEGTDAAQLLCEKYPAGMPTDLVVEIVTAIADALDYAHDQGLLHRDVKPANILISHSSPGPQRRILLTDFGVARRLDDVSGLTETNMTVGTVSYIAPEQLVDGPIDGRADQYALAATAFHLLTGSPPFADKNPAVVITKHLHAPPPPLGDIRPDLAGCDEPFIRALAKRRIDRFGRCQDFADELRRCTHSACGAPAGATASAPVALVAPGVHTDRPPVAPAPAARAPAPPLRPVGKTAGLISAILAIFAVGFLVLLALGLPRERQPAPPNIDVPSATITAPPGPPEPEPPVVSTVVPAETATEPSPPQTATPTETWTPPPTTTTWVPTTTPPATSTRPTTTSVSPPVTTAVTGSGNRPAVGSACTASQVGAVATSNTNLPVRCVSTPSGFTWVSGS